MIELQIDRRDRWLAVALPGEHDVASWAVVGGGVRRARHIAWLEVRDRDLPITVDPEAYLRARMSEHLGEAGLPDALGLMTSRSLSAYVDVQRSAGACAARCLATVGLGNARRVGDPVGTAARVGTINVLCCVSVPLRPEALLETLALVAEARTLAIRETEVASPVSGAPITGSGTDCIVVAAPVGDGERHAGKHTIIGHLVGAAVVEAVARGAHDWLAERRAAAAS
jgi:adenosylcobinamide amidohydrolase